MEKKIIITVEETEDGFKHSLDAGDINPFEVFGLLRYYEQHTSLRLLTKEKSVPPATPSESPNTSQDS